MKNHLIHFTKMHGLGNDFMVINNIDQAINSKKLPIKQFANRHQGVGFDQLLIIEPSQQADFFCRIFNADGSEAEQCGNGLRCVARFVHEEKIHTNPLLTIETKAGVFPIFIQDDDYIRVTMGIPRIQESLVELPLSSEKLPVSVISTGNPHAIVKVDNVDTLNIEKLGPEISMHTYFPEGANVGFMQVMDQSRVQLRTFERGIGETHACGSNACAAAVAGIINGWLNSLVNIEFRYGNLTIEWEGGNEPIHMIGPAISVFTGEISCNFNIKN